MYIEFDVQYATELILSSSIMSLFSAITFGLYFLLFYLAVTLLRNSSFIFTHFFYFIFHELTLVSFAYFYLQIIIKIKIIHDSKKCQEFLEDFGKSLDLSSKRILKLLFYFNFYHIIIFFILFYFA